MNHSMKTIFSLPKTETRMVIVSLACLALFAGCSFAPKYAEPSVQTPAAFKEMTPAQASATDGWKTAEPMDNALRGQWWKMFHEPELNAFESQVNVSNQTVAVALANFLAARAVVKQARSQYFPTVTASPSVSESRQQIKFIKFFADFFHVHRICAAIRRLLGAGFLGPYSQHGES